MSTWVGCRTFPLDVFLRTFSPLDVSPSRTFPPAFLHTRTFLPMYGAAECKLHFL